MSSSNNQSENDFRRIYAKAIADALRAKEEEDQKQTTKSFNQDESISFESAKKAYVELCYDDPIISGDDGCRCLARALRPKRTGFNTDNTLGLCNRLVDGLLQAVARAESQLVAPKPPSAESDAVNNSSTFGVVDKATREGYAELAFTIFVEGPYRCIQQADNLPVISAFLGSFEPPEPEVGSNELTSEQRSNLVDEATASIVDGMEKVAINEENYISDYNAPQSENDDASSSSGSDFFHRNETKQPNAIKEYDSIEEIFAQESDPDDYDFGPDLYGGQNYGMSAVNNGIDSCGFDAQKLSKPKTINQTWDGNRKALHYLMSNLSYGKLLLSSLSSRTWLDMGISDTLADFSFVLLMHHTQPDPAEKDSLLRNLPDENTDDSPDLSALWDRPLFLLRDRALDSNRDHDALVPYLQLLQAFLSHSQNSIISILSVPQQSLLTPITSVGLSGLATLCASKDLTGASASKMTSSSVLSICPRAEVQKTIFSSLYSLAHILETVRPGKLVTIEHERLWIRTAACIFSIIEYVTNLRARYDFQPVFEGSARKKFELTDADAKCILDSGVFRELLALFSASSRYSTASADDSKSSDACEVTRTQLLRTIYALCISSPEVLGRYAIRVPDLAKEVQSAEFMEKHTLDSILWGSLNASLTKTISDTPAPRLKLRAGVKVKTSVSMDDMSMSEKCNTRFLKLCSSVQLALHALNDSISKNTLNNLTEEQIPMEELAQHKKSLEHIIYFANCIANSSNARNMWISTLNYQQDASQCAREKIMELRSVLANIPSYSLEVQTQSSGHKKNDSDNDKNGHEENILKQKEMNSVQMKKEYGRMVASVRSSIKVIASAIESQEGGGLCVTRDVRCNISSKTD